MAGRRSRFDAADRYFELSEEEQARIAEEVEASFLFEELAATTIKRREETREEVEHFWAKRGGKGDVWALNVEELTRLLKTWLSAKVEGTKPSPKRAKAGATHIAFSTLSTWRMSLMRVITKHVENGIKLLNDSLYVELCRHSGWLTVHFRLQVLQDRKQFCGRMEVRLITEALYANCEDLEWTLQTDAALKIVFMTGVRPGALGPATEEYLQDGKYFKWKNIVLMIESFLSYHSGLEFTALKGYNLIAQKRLEANLRPAQRPENVIFEVAPPLILLALKRGLIRGVKTLDELFAYKGGQLHWEDFALDQPVFLRGKIGGQAGCQTGVPMRSPGITDCIQVAGRRVNLETGTYDFRRNYGDEIDSNYGEAGAKTGLSHNPRSNTYSNRYGREAANLDDAGAVMHEGLANRQELNAFRAPALQPHVGLASATVSKLLAMQEKATEFRINAPPPQLKRKAAALIQPYAPAPTPFVDGSISDDECRSHQYWVDFIAEPEWKYRQAELERHRKIWEEALADIPSVPGQIRSRTTEAKLKDAYPDSPQIIGSYKEFIRLRDIQNASSSRKLQAIRVAISATRTALAGSSTGPTTATYAARQERMEQLKTPSVLVEIALSHATPAPEGSAASVVDNAEDDLVDPNFKPFVEGNERVVDDIPVWVVRQGYMRLLWSCGKESHSTCPDCQVDPTVDKDDKERIWTAFKLARHREQFHTVDMQLVRWWHKHQSCFLCALDQTPIRFNSRSSHTRHINREKGYHAGDPRLPLPPGPQEFQVQCPPEFLSPDELEAQEEYWATSFAAIELPEDFLSPEQIEAQEEYWAATFASIQVPEEFLTERQMSELPFLDVEEVNRAYKRIKMSKEDFVYVEV
ncbi:hypothetical protein DFH06DRAFT_1210995 [Mycena polygramma]|nr:hypothetical protein DFH06DRAFT_1210995 [Mycena polygramma]